MNALDHKYRYINYAREELIRDFPNFIFEFDVFHDFLVITCAPKGSTDRVWDSICLDDVSTVRILRIARELVDRLNKQIAEQTVGYVSKNLITNSYAIVNPFVNIGGFTDIKKVIFSNPATIVFFEDGTKEVVKCSENDTYSPAAGIAFCVMKKCFGHDFHHEIRKWMKQYNEENKKQEEPNNIFDIIEVKLANIFEMKPEGDEKNNETNQHNN